VPAQAPLVFGVGRAVRVVPSRAQTVLAVGPGSARQAP